MDSIKRGVGNRFTFYIAQHLDEPISYTYSGNKEEGERMKKYHTTIQEYIASINKSLRETPKLNVDDEIKFDIQNGKVIISSISWLDYRQSHAGVFRRVDVAWGPRKRERRRNANPSPRRRFLARGCRVGSMQEKKEEKR